ncbi:MAG: YbbR-like domain-containing protein [Gemmatimonadota bacterium]|nr:YbbR-like domain-containing protein [Gemmatimonadota bacterium]MDE2870610.1 YbbR-like domain-containing protein [Gemmatimonadota bacterium]
MSFPGVLVRNWRLKITALALAVLLWVTMRLTDDRIDRLSIPGVEVRVEHVHRDWFLRQPPSPASVQMSVTGPVGDILRVAMSRPAIVIRVDTVAKEDTVLTLLHDWVTNIDRSSVDIENFQPSTVRLLFERNQEEEIPVSVRLTGELPDSLAMVSEPRANLLFTRVRGPASQVDALETVFLEPFDLSRVTGPGRFEVPLDTTGLGGLVVNPTTATLAVEVATRRSRVLAPLPVEFRGGDGTLEPDPARVGVTLFGAEEVLNRVDTAGIRVWIGAEAAAVRVVVAQEGLARVPLVLGGLPARVVGTVEVDSVTVRAGEVP